MIKNKLTLSPGNLKDYVNVQEYVLSKGLEKEPLSYHSLSECGRGGREGK